MIPSNIEHPCPSCGHEFEKLHVCYTESRGQIVQCGKCHALFYINELQKLWYEGGE